MPSNFGESPKMPTIGLVPGQEVKAVVDVFKGEAPSAEPCLECKDFTAQVDTSTILNIDSIYREIQSHILEIKGGHGTSALVDYAIKKRTRLFDEKELNDAQNQ